MAGKMRKKNKFECSACPGWCCSYEHIRVTKDDIALLAQHYECSAREIKEQVLDRVDGAWMLRHKDDPIFKSICILFDRVKRCCMVYESRPDVCHKFPWGRTCGYYDFIKFEREMMGDDEFIPLPYPKPWE